MKYLVRIFSFVLIAGIIFGMVQFSSSLAQDLKSAPAQAADEKIETALLDKLSADGSADFIVNFVQQADLSPAYQMNWKDRGWFVYNTLNEVANESQAASKAMLDKMNLKYQTFFTGNELYVWGGNLIAAQTLAGLPEVASIRATRVYSIDPAIEGTNPLLSSTWAGELLANHASYDFSPDAVTDWGITDTKADQFWNSFGFQGDGIVVANIDTGVDHTHPALSVNYKCEADPSNPECWLDPGTANCTSPDGGPCDTIYYGIYHGSHTMGTMAADNDPSLPYIVGMAPNAQWIACMGCPSGSCPDFDLNTCADWIVAPNGNPDARPNIVNNSWGGPGGNTDFLSKVIAWRADGIFPAFSAGNNSTCNSLGSPGDYQESFGSASHQVSRAISGFSSKGPSAFGDDPYTKPNLSAPGEDINSTQPGNNWTLISGTSMASPHTAGAVALLWSCNSSLVGQIDETFQVLQATTDTPPPGTCSAPADGEGNYTFGYGYLDTLTMGQQFCISDWGALDGHVYQAGSELPIVGATVTGLRDEGGSWHTETDASGYYTMTVGAGHYTLEATHPHYTTGTVSGLEVPTDTLVTQDFFLDPRGHLFGYVTDADSGAPLAATVSVAGGPTMSTDPATGYYEFYLDPGTYDVTASATDYANETVSVVLGIGSEVQQDFGLVAAISVVPDPIALTLVMGEVGTVDSQMTNNMAVPYPFEFKEKVVHGKYVGEDILVVAKDTSAAPAMESALSALGVTYLEVTDTAFQSMPVGDLLQYQAVFYAGSTGFSGAPTASELLLMAYLDAGGQLYISDNDLGYGRNGSIFYDTYLQASYFADDGGTALTGEGMMAGLNLDVTSDPYPDSFTVGPEGVRIFKWSTTDYAGGDFVERNAYKAIYTAFDFEYISNDADAIALMQRITDEFLAVDIPWFGTSITSGEVPAGGNIGWTNALSATLGSGIAQPGEYTALLNIAPVGNPSLPQKNILVDMTVLPSPTFGQIEGVVTSDRPGDPLEANILIEATDGTTVTLTTDPTTGYYSYWLDTGNYVVTASSPGYLPETVDVAIEPGLVATQDFLLQLNAPWIVVDPASLTQSLEIGGTADQAMTIHNNGQASLTFELQERNGEFIPSMQGEDILVVEHDVTAAAGMEAALTTLGYTYLGVTDTEFQAMTVDQLLEYLAVFHAGTTGYSGAPTASETLLMAYLDAGGSLYIADNDLGFYRNGSVFYDTYLQAIYQIDHGGEIVDGLDIMAGLTINLSSDPYPDGISVGAEGTSIFQFQGNSYQNGTAVARNDYRAVYTGFDFQNVTDPAQQVEVISRALDFIAVSDIPWLTETPITGTVGVGEIATVNVSFNAGAVAEPGVYTGLIKVKNSDPLNRSVDVPVTLTVTPSAGTGRLEGTITGLGSCDTESYPLEADVLVENSTGMTWNLVSNADGYYSQWLPADTYTVTASAPGHLDASGVGVVASQQTTTVDLGLRSIEPCVSVDPTEFTVVLPVDRQLDDTLSIINTGAGELTWEMHETTATVKTVDQDVIVNVPAIAAPTTPIASRGEPRSFPARSFSMHIGQVSASMIDVLLVTPDDVGGGDISLILSTLAAFPDLNVTLWDGNAGTPTVADMKLYDVVFVGNDILWSSSAIDKTTLSNNMADYIDAGGKILAGSFIWSYDDWGFGGGRFITEDYSPFEVATTDYFVPASLGSFDPDSPLMAGITALTDNFNHQDPALTPNAIWAASWDDGKNYVAISPNVVGLNQEYFNYADFGGQTGELLHNALKFLGGAPLWVDVPWVTEVPTSGVVLPGDTFNVDVTFDTSGLTAGQCYTAALGLVHDAAGQDNPLFIPLNLCVSSTQSFYLPFLSKN